MDHNIEKASAYHRSTNKRHALPNTCPYIFKLLTDNNENSEEIKISSVLLFALKAQHNSYCEARSINQQIQSRKL